MNDKTTEAAPAQAEPKSNMKTLQMSPEDYAIVCRAMASDYAYAIDKANDLNRGTKSRMMWSEQAAKTAQACEAMGIPY